MSAWMGIVAWAGATVIRALGLTWRIRIDEERLLEAARGGTRRVIFAFWHGRLLPLAYIHRSRAIQVLASEHRDGELLGRTIRHLGFGHVRGSSTRGGSRAILELAEKLRAGHDLGLTVDGPRGPRYVVKPGLVEIAKLTGAPIVPLTSGSRRHRTFASWDAFELPLPFTRVRVRYGKLVWVPADADKDALEAGRREVERVLREITEENDRIIGST